MSELKHGLSLQISILGFVIDYAWICNMTAERAVMLVKKVTYFGEFGYLNSSCIRKSIIAMFFLVLQEINSLVAMNSATDQCLRKIAMWPESWRESLNIYLLSVLRFWTLSIERFGFFILIYFEWRDTKNQQLIVDNSWDNSSVDAPIPPTIPTHTHPTLREFLRRGRQPEVSYFRFQLALTQPHLHC